MAAASDRPEARNSEPEALNAPADNSRPIRWLMLALLAWGGMLALGTFLYRVRESDSIVQATNLPLYRGLIVLTCTLAFLGLWLAALALRRRRSNGERGA